MFEGLESLVTGSFLLVDQHLPEHSFVTPTALDDFRKALIGACHRRLHGGSNHFDWQEEVPLLRCDSDADPEQGLDVLLVPEAGHVDSMVADGLDHVLSGALDKFAREHRWAKRHIIVLDKEDGFSTVQRVSGALKWITDDSDLQNVDLILLVSTSEASVVWQRT